MDADTVTCAVVPEMYPTDGEHVLHVYPYTAVIVSSTISMGGTENLKAGDMVYYTGYSDTPDVLAHDIMAYRIFKMDALSADVASRVGAPR
jgi:hypothetical protein